MPLRSLTHSQQRFPSTKEAQGLSPAHSLIQTYKAQFCQPSLTGFKPVPLKLGMGKRGWKIRFKLRGRKVWYLY